MKDPVKNLRIAEYPLGDITQYYGENVALYKQLDLNGHNGIDIVRPHGEHMYACASGVICDLKDDAGGYGKHIRILEEYEPGKYREWTYGHMHFIGVKLGQEVKEGQFVGLMGNTGFVVSGNTPYWDSNPYAGTHVHFGVRELVKDIKGWRYPYGGPRVRCLNYDNGIKGALDPVPYFLPPELKSSKVIHMSDKLKDKVVLQFGYVLKSLGL